MSTASITSTPSTDLDEMAIDVVEALVDDGYEARAAEACVRDTYTPGDDFTHAYGKALTVARAKRYEKALAAANRLRPALDPISIGGPTATRGHAGVAAPVTKPTPKTEEHVSSEKTCAHEGCGKKLCASTNQSGFCAKHFYESKRKSPAGEKDAAPASNGGARAAKKATKKAVNGNGHPHRIAPAVAQENLAQVSELDLDNLWDRMPLAAKAAVMFGRQESE